MAEAHRETIPWIPFRSCHRLVGRVYTVEEPPRQHRCTNPREECHINSYGAGGGGRGEGGRRYGEEGEILAEVAVGRWGAWREGGGGRGGGLRGRGGGAGRRT